MALHRSSSGSGADDPIAAGDPSVGQRVTVADTSRHLSSPGLALVDGELVMVYRDGPSHQPVTGSTRGFLVMVRSTDLGRTWSSPVTVVDDDPEDANDPCLTLLADGRVALTYKSYDGTNNTAKIRFSDDQGATFGAAVTVSAWSTSAVSAPVVELDDGTLLVFYYGGGEAVVTESTDGGATWSSPTTIASSGGTFVEPYAQLLADGTLLCLIRETGGENIYTSSSADAGSTWTTPTLAFSGSARQTHMQFASGTIVALFRVDAADMEDQHLVGRVSRDGGANWGAAFTVDDTDGTRMAYGQVIEVSPGQAAVAYGMEAAVSNATDSDVYFRWLVDGSGIVSLTDGEFIDLTDTPSSYAGQAGKAPLVNDAEDALEFADALDADGVRDAGRWEVWVDDAAPPEPILEPDGTDWVYVWVEG